MIEVKRKQGETTSVFLRRFSRNVQQSKILKKARKLRYSQPDQSKRERRISAIRRVKIQDERKKLEKLGKKQTNK